MPTTQIYQNKDVIAVQKLHQHIIDTRFSFPSVFDEMEAYTINLKTNYQDRNPAVCIEISNYHPHFISRSTEAIFDAGLQLKDFQKVIATEYGFDNWEAIKPSTPVKHDVLFESAIDLLLSGNLEIVAQLLKKHPQLIKSRSAYGHQAGLIHYLGANGVEIWRQVIPKNLKESLYVLLQFGADPEMKANLYGFNNLLALLTSSEHAWKAGVAKETIGLLEKQN